MVKTLSLPSLAVLLLLITLLLIPFMGIAKSPALPYPSHNPHYRRNVQIIKT